MPNLGKFVGLSVLWNWSGVVNQDQIWENLLGYQLAGH